MPVIFFRYVVCISKGMKPHLVLNDEEKQQRFEIIMTNFLFTLNSNKKNKNVHILTYSIIRKAFKIYLVDFFCRGGRYLRNGGYPPPPSPIAK